MPEGLGVSEILFVIAAIAFNLAIWGGFIWLIYKSFTWTRDLYRRQHAFMDRAESHFEAMERMQARLLELAAEGAEARASESHGPNGNGSNGNGSNGNGGSGPGGPLT